MKKTILFILLTLFTFSIGKCQIWFAPNIIAVTLPGACGCSGTAIGLDTVCVYANTFTSLPYIDTTCTQSTWPDPCAIITVRHGDTVYFKLCTIPCELIEICGGTQYALLKVNYTTNTDSVFVDKVNVINNGHQIIVHNSKLELSDIEIIDTFGRLVSSSDISGDREFVMDIKTVIGGVYFINIISKAGQRKVIKIAAM